MSRQKIRWVLVLTPSIFTLLIFINFPGQEWLVSAGTPEEEVSRPAGLFVARIYYDELSDLERLAAYDIWEYNNTAEKYVLALLDNESYAQLRHHGWRVEVDEETSAHVRRRQVPELFAEGFRTVDELYADLAEINGTYPSLTELVKYGESHCQAAGGCVTPGGDAHPGFDLLAMRVTNEGIGGSSTISETAIFAGSKPVFFLMANIHARELTTLELAMRLIDWLVEGYGIDAQATWLVDWHEIWVVPTANPDGHWLVELGDQSPYNAGPFYQRKNANDSSGCGAWPPGAAQYGVDLNRNHNVAWGGSGASGDPCSPTYRGTAAASEAEVSQLQHLIGQLISDQRGPNQGDAAPEDTTGILITLHSYSELVLWPWGHTSLPAPNKTGLQAIGDKLATYNGYKSCQPPVWPCLYAASGTSDDWAYGELGIPAFTFEVGTQFMPPYSEVDASQWPRNRPALLYAAKIARAPYQEVKGPDALDISVTSTTGRLTFTAAIDDRENGNDVVVAAAYTIDAPHWASAVDEKTVEAIDGAFDSPLETVSTTLDSSSLSPGQHLIFLRGQDAAGHWGPVSASYFSVKTELSTYFPLVWRD